MNSMNCISYVKVSTLTHITLLGLLLIKLQWFTNAILNYHLIDVDECAAEELNNCDQMCTVTGDGWYNCSCEDGFTLDQDGHTCNGGLCV